MGNNQARRLSVLVPVLNEEAGLAAFLEHLRQLGVDEIVVADGGSHDNTIAIAEDYADIVVSAPTGRGCQINAAAKAASGDIFWILHCDCLAPPSARADIDDVISRPGISLGAFPIEFGNKHIGLIIFGVFSRLDCVFTTFGDQGFFCTAADYHQVGGAPDIALFEDVELRRRLKTIGQVAKTQSTMLTSPRRFLQRGVLRQQWCNTRLLLRYLLGAKPDQLAKHYRAMTR